MSIEEYIHIITKTPFPILFIIGIILSEWLVYKIQKKKFSFSHVFSNFGVLFVGVAIFSLFDHYILSRSDVLAFSAEHAFFTAKISWGIFFFWLIVLDLLNYLTHVLYHKSDFFWMFHAVHHSDKNLDASTTIRVSFTASFFTLSSYAFLGVFGISVVLLPVLAQTMFLQQIVVHSFLLRGVIPSFISYVLVTPDIHALHHTEKYNNRNYGFLFSVWDLLFKTAYIKKHDNEAFGVDVYSGTKNPFVVQAEPIVHYIKGK